MFDESGSPSAADTEPAPEPAPEDSVVTRFKSCRWHDKKDGGSEYCTHRDVLPYAGRNGFNPEAWCPDCKFYKLRRTVKKRDTQPEY